MVREILASVCMSFIRLAVMFSLWQAVKGLQTASSRLLSDRDSTIRYLSFVLRRVFRDRISNRKDLDTFKTIHDDVMRVDLGVGVHAVCCLLKQPFF